MTDMALPYAAGKTRDEATRVFWIRAWLVTSAVLVFIMVLVGGATRLTDSGLSITEWRPITGAIPPLTQEAWLIELEKYRQIPEYQLINKGMTMEAFQFIYWWEWGHRFLGRVIGIVFFMPFAFFWLKGWLSTRLKWQGSLLLALGGFQGFIGWYMVSSGLVDRVDVSQYRLAMHLGMAAIIFAVFAYVIRHADGRAGAFRWSMPGTVFATVLTGLIFIQVLMGALVAGLDAGLTFVTWPLMDGQIIPNGLLVQSPWYLNFGENVMTVQFNHRLGAYIVWALVALHAILIYRREGWSISAKWATGLFALVSMQAVVGVLTLINLVPVPLALTHQGLAFLILGYCVLHADRLARVA